MEVVADTEIQATITGHWEFKPKMFSSKRSVFMIGQMPIKPLKYLKIGNRDITVISLSYQSSSHKRRQNDVSVIKKHNSHFYLFK